MGKKWKKTKLALGFKASSFEGRSSSDAALLASPLSSVNWSVDSPVPAAARFGLPAAPLTSLLLRLPLSYSRSSKKICSICLAPIKREKNGQTVSAAECPHSFHLHCIASNLKLSPSVCPVCGVKWKETPLQNSNFDPPSKGRAEINPLKWAHNDPSSQSLEPINFDDDESLPHQLMLAEKTSNDAPSTNRGRTIEIRTYPEVSRVSQSTSRDNFAILVHLKAVATARGREPSTDQSNPSRARTPVDLVTVLDISGSMVGTKLALLKRAMGFVIQNLGPNDRLSVIAFSSTARRLFPLRIMSASGRHHALVAVNSLVANGGTNIAEGMRKGAKVMAERRERNPVGSIILLSDGRDTYHGVLLPSFVHDRSSGMGSRIPVHAFGFGADHDTSWMHRISELSGGTFSFIEEEGMIQDAFAQCIGGLLSVVAQRVRVGVESAHPAVFLRLVQAGSFHSRIEDHARAGFINVGDLYAEEERDFLVSVNVPAEHFGEETSLLRVKCEYKDPLTKEIITLGSENVATIRRCPGPGQVEVSVEVDRQRNRIKAAESMARAQMKAEQGDLTGSVSVLENFRRELSETLSARSRDRLCVALDAEIREMQERMMSMHVYEASGRAYLLSGLSSHSWQRETVRGCSTAGTDGSGRVQIYRTPMMAEMLTLSRNMLI